MGTFYNALMGMAVADAIGNPMEFVSGICGSDLPVLFDGSWDGDHIIHVSDDTQMTMFVMEALMDDTWRAGNHIKRWYATQTTSGPTHGSTGHYRDWETDRKSVV